MMIAVQGWNFKRTVVYPAKVIGVSLGDAAIGDVTEIQIGSRADYAPFHELGTGKGVPPRTWTVEGTIKMDGADAKALQEALKELSQPSQLDPSTMTVGGCDDDCECGGAPCDCPCHELGDDDED